MIRKWIRSKLWGVGLWLDSIVGSVVLHRAITELFEPLLRGWLHPHDEDDDDVDVVTRYATFNVKRPRIPPDEVTHYFYGDGYMYDYCRSGWRFPIDIKDERWSFSSRKVTR